MDPILITIIVILAAVFAAAGWMDLRRRHLHDTQPVGEMGAARRRTNLEGKEKGGRWGAGH